ncbi:NAD(P)/FAD-dependent oxidoreductase [Acidocella facilis]|uniref:NAD(P)/FAD-dependent oxidoreductase n=1 Tax=Acidocella facilis TaxID=525 RepID=UPI000691DDDE|nr:FAD-dependent oxidoreductase [Acidocella facilis]
MILVVGGGPAGAACAIALAQAGRAVTLIEREPAATDKVCGEFVSAEAQAYLTRLGLPPALLGGQPITRLRLVRGGRTITAPLPFAGRGVRRRGMDETLLDVAEQSGVRVRRGQAVRRIDSGGISVEVGGEVLHPATLVLASGKHEVRGAARPARPGRLVGLKSYFSLAAGPQSELVQHVELIMFRGGYAGLQMVEDGLANLSLLVDKAVLREAGNKWPALLAGLQRTIPHLASRLDKAADRLPEPLAIAGMPFGFLHRPHAADPPDLFRLGDQAAVIQSFTGDGLAIALHSAALAAAAIIAGASAQTYHQQLRTDVRWQVFRAGALHHALSAPLLGPVLFAGAALWPATLARAAAWTRVPEAALARCQSQARPGLCSLR